MIPRVWAPNARQRVTLEVDGKRVDMARRERGWWSAEADLAPGSRYRFAIDDGEPLPDPRSRSQPDGVLGASAVVDESFPWTDHGFRAAPLASGLVYELHLGCFTEEGTFDSAVQRLPHLQKLGVTHVELMPVAEGSGLRGWGYDGAALFAPHRAYGGVDGMKRFVDAAHAAGIAVLLDVVYNHLGPVGNVLERFGPYFTDEHHTPWGKAVNLDQSGADEVRRFFVDNARLWIEQHHVDGLRLDAVHALHDRSARPFLEELAVEVEALEATLAKPLVLVAESDLNDPRMIRGIDAGGLGLDAQWSDDLHHAIHAALTDERTAYYGDYGSLRDVAHALERGFVYDGRYAPSRGRAHGRPLGDVPGWKLLGYAQTHDQIGNRARGERLCHLVPVERAMAAAALVLLAPFTPMLFMGEEWAASTPFRYFTDHQDADLANAVREGRRREFAAFGWKPEDVPDPQALETFAASRLRWGELREPMHARVLAWHRDLIALRRAHRELADGRLDRVSAVADEAARTLVVQRGSVCLVVNLGPEQPVTLPAHATSVLLASSTADLEGSAIRLPPDGVAVVALA